MTRPPTLPSGSIDSVRRSGGGRRSEVEDRKSRPLTSDPPFGCAQTLGDADREPGSGRQAKRSEVGGLGAGLDAQEVGELAALEIAAGKRVEPQAIGHARAGQGIGEFFEGTDCAPEQVYFGAQADFCARDFKLLDINPNRAGKAIEEAIEHPTLRPLGAPGFKSNLVGQPAIDRFLPYQLEVISGDQLGRQKVLA